LERGVVHVRRKLRPQRTRGHGGGGRRETVEGEAGLVDRTDVEEVTKPQGVEKYVDLLLRDKRKREN